MPYKDPGKRKEYCKKRYAKNKAKVQQYNKEYGITHKEDISKNKKQYYQKNRQKLREQHKQYYETHKEEFIKNQMAYYRKHKQNKSNYDRVYRKLHSAERSFSSNARRVKKLNAGGLHTLEQWEKLKEQFDFTCPACGGKEPEIKLTRDHIVPIIKNGTDNIDNIQPLCRNCNSSKKTRIKKYDYYKLRTE